MMIYNTPAHRTAWAGAKKLLNGGGGEQPGHRITYRPRRSVMVKGSLLCHGGNQPDDRLCERGEGRGRTGGHQQPNKVGETAEQRSVNGSKGKPLTGDFFPVISRGSGCLDTRADKSADGLCKRARGHQVKMMQAEMIASLRAETQNNKGKKGHGRAMIPPDTFTTSGLNPPAQERQSDNPITISPPARMERSCRRF